MTELEDKAREILRLNIAEGSYPSAAILAGMRWMAEQCAQIAREALEDK